jgi:crotonobetaine/carnitine-CoA ligase
LGDKPWIVTAERAYGFREMDKTSNRLARGLAAIGIKHGQTVLLMLPDTIDYVLAWCALAKLGAIEVPVNNHAKGTVFAHVVNDSLAETMIVDRQYLDRLEFVLPELKHLKRVILYSKDAMGGEAGLSATLAARFSALRFETLFDADDAALPEPGPRYTDIMGVMYTSGTTGPS